jgi:hypothetical protein
VCQPSGTSSRLFFPRYNYFCVRVYSWCLFVWLYIYFSMVHWWHTRTTRDQSGRRMESEVLPRSGYRKQSPDFLEDPVMKVDNKFRIQSRYGNTHFPTHPECGLNKRIFWLSVGWSHPWITFTKKKFCEQRDPTENNTIQIHGRQLCLLLWINKARVTEKTYLWVSVWWKTKN